MMRAERGLRDAHLDVDFSSLSWSDRGNHREMPSEDCALLRAAKSLDRAGERSDSDSSACSLSSSSSSSNQARKRAMRCPLPLVPVPVPLGRSGRVGKALMPLPVRWGERVSARERLKH